MDESKIIESFKRIKEDIDNLFYEITELKRTLWYTTEKLSEFDTKPRGFDTSTDTSTMNLPFKAEKSQNQDISIGNNGVSTDRQTIRQTDNKALTELYNQIKQEQNNLEKVPEIVDSLDTIRSEIISKFDSLTEQEMIVFITIYSLEEQGLSVDYQILAEKLSISESSIRDYVQRLLTKGIPLKKIRQNNKKITLKISENLKQIAPLSTIKSLRENR